MAEEAVRILVPQSAAEDGGSSLGREECTLLAVACHNLGAEREHLGNWAGAAIVFRQGADAANRSLGPGSTLSRALTDNCSEALSKAEKHPTTPDRPLIARPNVGVLKRQWRSAHGKPLPTTSAGRRAAAHAAWAA